MVGETLVGQPLKLHHLRLVCETRRVVIYSVIYKPIFYSTKFNIGHQIFLVKLNLHLVYVLVGVFYSIELYISLLRFTYTYFSWIQIVADITSAAKNNGLGSPAWLYCNPALATYMHYITMASKQLVWQIRR